MLRKDSRATETDFSPNDSGPVAATLTARAAEPPPLKTGEEGMHVFWRVFGGALLSIGALVGITLYNGMQSGLAELRGEIARINEARADLVRKEEFNARISAAYERISAAQSQFAALNASGQGLKTECDGLKERLTKSTTDLDAIRKESAAAVESVKKDLASLESVKEKLAGFAAELKAAREDAAKARTDLERNQAADNDRKMLRDEQYKLLEKTLKELQTALQDCQVKLARIEGQQQVKPAETKPKDAP